MLWQKRIRGKKTKNRINSADSINNIRKKRWLFPLAFGFVCALSICGLQYMNAGSADIGQSEAGQTETEWGEIEQAETGQAVSSDIRQFLAEPAGEAVYVVSTADVAVSENKSVSGNGIDGLTVEAGEVLELVNQARAEVGLAELVWNTELASAADVRVKEIQKAFSHTRPDGSDWWTVNSEVIYGENLAKGYQSADSVMEAWMGSTEHKDNILYSGFKTIGVAVYELDGKRYWVQEFGY